MRSDRGRLDMIVLGVVITGVVAYLGFYVLSNAATLAPTTGEPFYRGAKQFKEGLVVALLLLLAAPPAYLFLFRGR